MTTPRFTARFVAPVLIGPVLNPINTTMISVALVPIAASLQVGSAVVIWLVAGLYLASAIAQPTMGKLADRFGPKKIYVIGLVVVMVAGILPTLLPTFAGVLIARVLIGVGTSAAYPSAMALIRDQSIRLARPTPASLLSGISIASLTTTAVGPPLGGLLIGLFGWQSIFLANIPLAGIALVLSILWLPADSTRQKPVVSGSAFSSIDPVGLLLFAVAVASLLVFLLDLSAGYWWLLALAIVVATVLVWWELRRKTPFIDIRMLASNGPLSRTYLRMFLIYLASYSMVYGFAQWLQDAGGYSSGQAGLLQLPTAILAGAASVLVARTSALRLPLVFAGLFPLVGGLLLASVTSDATIGLLVLIAGLFGLAQGLASVTNQAALYRQAPGEQIGSASGLSRTSIYLSAIVSSSVIGLVFGQAP
ncbi:MAG: transporter, partial [Glaciihabitans sp.]|nr:transporter [Glaciihabitans sp.]